MRRDYSKTLEEHLTSLLNQFSVENESNTPDFILANYLIDCLATFHRATNARSIWWNQEYPSFTTKELQIK